MPLSATHGDDGLAAVKLTEEVEALRRHLERLASNPDTDLDGRYGLERPPMPPGWYWRLRWLAGGILRWLRSVWIRRPAPWPVSLRQGSAGARAKPLLIWAISSDRDTLRHACGDFARLEESWRGYAPVLVTDVADFAFFSRLGWLVEYVPRLAGEGKPYDERKIRLLARLYHGAPVLPVRAIREAGSRGEEIRRWLRH